MEEIVRRLVEATGRGICQPDQEFLECLCEGYLEVKGSIEDTMDAVFGKFQGGSVDIMTTEDVEHWKEQMARILRDIYVCTFPFPAIVG